MGKRLYVGNLPYNTTDEDLRSLFGQVGEVTSASVMTDRATGRSRGFGFVEMGTDELAQQAIARFNGYSLGERLLAVNEARPMAPRDDRGEGAGRDRRGRGRRDRRDRREF